MRRIFTSPAPYEVHLRRAFLEAADIPCSILNEHAQGARGALFADVELHLLSDEDFERATALLAEYESQSPKPSQGSWRCEGCGERIEWQFTDCWKCGQSRGNS